jgi:hypothetical protein
MFLMYLHPRKQIILAAACAPYESKKANIDTKIISDMISVAPKGF